MPKNCEPYFKTIQNIIFRCTLTTLPFIFGLLVNLIFNYDAIYYARGEFLLYSVSLVAASILAYQSLSNLSDLAKGWLNIFALLALVLFSGTYAMIMTDKKTPDLEVMKILSIASFLIALIIFFFSQLSFNKELAIQKAKMKDLEFKKKNSDAGEKRRGEQEDLLNNLS